MVSLKSAPLKIMKIMEIMEIMEMLQGICVLNFFMEFRKIKMN